MFTPFFILVLPLISGYHITPTVAIYVGLIIEVCGFGSAFLGYYAQGLVDFRLARRLLIVLIPFAALASALAPYVPEDILLILLGFIMVILSVLLARAHKSTSALPQSQTIPASEIGGISGGSGTSRPSGEEPQRVLVDRYGNSYAYPAPRTVYDYLLALIGGAFVGLVGVGVGEIKTTYFILVKRMPPRIAVATGVFIVLVTVTAAIVTRIALTAADIQQVTLPWNLLAMCVPAVLLGGQIAARLSRHINAEMLTSILTVIFAIVGVILILRGALSA